MKEALIVTWCMTSLNYGELLQAYAMQSLLRQRGIEAVVVSYLDKKVAKAARKTSIYRENCLGYYRFRKFVKEYMGDLKQCGNRGEVLALSEDCDYILCGSDQIWNPNSMDQDMVLALNFNHKTIPKIAYAPSMGIKRVSSRNRAVVSEMAKRIDRIDSISVREKRAREILSGELNCEIACVLDPTLLISRREWHMLARKLRIKQKYIVVYILGKTEPYTNLIQRIADKYGAECIVWLDVIRGTVLKGKNVKRVRMASPQEFLGFIENAEAVVTDSFHGVMFSVKFRRNLYILARRYSVRNIEGDVRLEDITERLGIQERLVRKASDIDALPKAMDYTQVSERYHRERKHSLQFLEKALKVGIRK